MKKLNLLKYFRNRRKLSKVRNRIRKGFSSEYGFLHIPKTGGTSMVALGNKLVNDGYSFPVNFGHSWNIEEIHDNFPKMKIAVMLRDPLERIISGFNSRLRQGRPSYNAVWTPQEAAAFAILPSAKHLLDAILHEDDYSISAVAYAFKHILHLKWNYCYYFKNTDVLKNHISMIHLIGHMADFDKFVLDSARSCDAPESLVVKLYARKHISTDPTSSVLDQYSDDEICRMRQRLSKEYAIYHELENLGKFIDPH